MKQFTTQSFICLFVSLFVFEKTGIEFSSNNTLLGYTPCKSFSSAFLFVSVFG